MVGCILLSYLLYRTFVLNSTVLCGGDGIETHRFAKGAKGWGLITKVTEGTAITKVKKEGRRWVEGQEVE